MSTATPRYASRSAARGRITPRVRVTPLRRSLHLAHVAGPGEGKQLRPLLQRGGNLIRPEVLVLFEPEHQARIHRAGTGRAKHGSADPLLAEFTSVIDVPPLRDRLEDLPTLLDALTAAACGFPGQRARRIHWSPMRYRR